MYAVIRQGNHQYRVVPGDTIQVEKFESEPGQIIDIEQVVALNDGETMHVGAPFVEGAVVKAEVVGAGRGKKIIVYKFKRRKGYEKRQGHRQNFVTLRVTEVQKDGQALQAAAPAAAAVEAPAEAEA